METYEQKHKKDLTSIPCFSSGTEAALWIERNCDRCYKSSRIKKNNDYTKSRCRIFDEIFIQWMGYGNELVSQRTYDTTQRLYCPYRKSNWPKKKKILKDKSLIINFE